MAAIPLPCKCLDIMSFHCQTRGSRHLHSHCHLLLKLNLRSHLSSSFGQKFRPPFFELLATLFSSHKRLGGRMLNKARGWGQKCLLLKIGNKIRWWRYEGAMTELISAANITNSKKVHTIGVVQSIQLTLSTR